MWGKKYFQGKTNYKQMQQTSCPHTPSAQRHLRMRPWLPRRSSEGKQRIGSQKVEQTEEELFWISCGPMETSLFTSTRCMPCQAHGYTLAILRPAWAGSAFCPPFLTAQAGEPSLSSTLSPQPVTSSKPTNLQLQNVTTAFHSLWRANILLCYPDFISLANLRVLCLDFWDGVSCNRG